MLLRTGRVLPVLLLGYLLGAAAPVHAVSFNGFWQHRATGGDDIETRHSFQQRYSLGAGTGLSFQPTHAISAGANLGYTRTESDVGQGKVTSDILVPSAYLTVTNDIFRANLTGSATESRRSSAPDQRSDNWDATLASAWDRTWWPELRIYYGEGTTGTRGTRQDGTPGGTDTRDSRYGMGLEWDLLLAKLFYNYNSSRGENLDDDSINENYSHFARVETGARFWHNRINVKFSQQVQQTKSEISVLVPEEGVFEDKLLTSTRYIVVDPLSVPFPDPELIEPDIRLEQGDTIAIENNLQAHLLAISSLGFDTSRVDELHVSFIGLPARIDDLQWELYVRNKIDDTWILHADIPRCQPADASICYEEDFTENLIRLRAIDQRVGEFKVVVTNRTGEDLAISGIDAIRLLTGSTSSRQTAYITNAGLNVRLTQTLSASSRMTLEKTDSEAGAADTEATRRTLSSSLRWNPSPLVTPSLGFSETRQEETGVPDAVNRAYSLMVATFPLPTLNVTLGATRTDRLIDDHKYATSDGYSLTSMAQIYPDLSAGFNANLTRSGSEQDDGTSTTTDSISSRLALNARLNPKLIADLTANYHRSESASTTSSGSDSTLSLAYRPSDLLSMRLTGSKTWSGSDTPDLVAYSLNMALLRTEKTRVTFRYNYSNAEKTMNNFGLDGSWDISRSLALQTRGTYTAAATDVWSILSSLALRL